MSENWRELVARLEALELLPGSLGEGSSPTQAARTTIPSAIPRARAVLASVVAEIRDALNAA